MERSSQVILRNESRLGPGELLLINPPRDALCQQLQAGGHSVRVSTQDQGDFRWLSGSGVNASFELLPEPITEPGAVILNLPREKDRLAMMLHALASRMPPDTPLWLVGENQAGIKSAGKHLASYFRNVARLDNARHCGLYDASGAISEKPFELADYEQSWQVDYAGKSITAVSLPGVFAHGRLDKGSQLLLQSLEKVKPAGRILDFACGSGVIGCSLLATDAEMDLTLLDVSALAIESSRLTLHRNGLAAALLPSDGLAELEGRYDWIISNPPFHRGVSNDLDIAAHFFADSGTFLTENGRIVIVCNRHLPYTSWLQNHFKNVERLDENREFLIIQAGKPRKV